MKLGMKFDKLEQKIRSLYRHFHHINIRNGGNRIYGGGEIELQKVSKITELKVHNCLKRII